MPRTHAVNLTLHDTPIFPDRCVICNAASPDDALSVHASEMRPFLNRWILPYRGNHFIPPACSRCRMQYKRGGRRRRLIQVLLFLMAAGVVFALLPTATPAGKLIVALLILVALVPMLVWRILKKLWPLPFHVTKSPDSFNYEFTNRACAQEFASLNHGAEVK